MRYMDPRRTSKDDEMGESSGDINSSMREGGCLDDIDAQIDASQGRTSRKFKPWAWAERCSRWADEARASLRGRRLFTLFAVVNLVNYLDRGVIPGSSEEFDFFIRQKIHTQRPDVFLGVLQSGFILGFSVACVVFARLARYRNPFSLMGTGLGIWCAAAVAAGLARPLGSYSFLLLARLLSGVGEASFVTVVPPLITETAPPGERGLWLALFYTAQPVGAGLGYVYGSVVATSRLGWPWAFYLEAVVMAPLALACSLVPHDNATAVPNAADYGASQGSRGACMAGEDMANDRSISEGLATSKSYDAGETPAVDLDHERSDRLAVSTPLLNERHHGARRRHADYARGPGSYPDESRGTWVVHDSRPEELEDDASDTDDIGAGVCRRRNAARGNALRNGEHRVRAPSSLRPSDATRKEGEVVAESEAAIGRLDDAAGSDGAAWLVVSPSSRGVYRRGGVLDREQEERRDILEVMDSQGSINREASTSALPNFSGLKENSDNASGNAIVEDVLRVVDRPVFCLVVLGAAANAAVTAGMSTFGTGFVTSLELLSSETAAAATFGAVICAAGLLGTPAGGALIDAADPEGRLGDGKKLVVVLTQAAALMCAATVVVIAATAQTSLVPFLLLFFCGGSMLFATTAHANLAVMLAAPKHLRPLSLAVNSIALHALGDVPSPTLIGALKDTLAPHCAEGAGALGKQQIVVDGPGFLVDAVGAMGVLGSGEHGVGGGEFDAAWVGSWTGEGAGEGWGTNGAYGLGGISDACRSERRGLHLTLLIVASWLLWTCLFFYLARAVQETALEHGMAPASWGDIRALVSKGLLRPAWTRRCWGCTGSPSGARKPWLQRRQWWRGFGSGRERRDSAGELGSSLEQALLASPSSPTTSLS